MKKLIAVLCLSILLLGAAGLFPGDASAFQRPPWKAFGLVNVLPIQAAFFDDVPVGVALPVPGTAGFEAGLAMFFQDEVLNEAVGAYTVTGLPVSADYSMLEARVAVSDNSMLRLGYGSDADPAAACQYYPLAWRNVTAKGVYVVKSAAVQAGVEVKKICIVLSDDPDTVSAGFAKALIDYIRLKKPTGETGWIENFYGSP